MDRALILGHSFVRRLQDIDFNLGQVFNVVKLGFKSGATLRDINVRDCLSYQVIVLVIGSNDLCNKDTHPREFAIDIIDRALEIVDLNLEHNLGDLQGRHFPNIRKGPKLRTSAQPERTVRI